MSREDLVHLNRISDRYLMASAILVKMVDKRFTNLSAVCIASQLCYNLNVDRYLQQLWRKFSTDPTIENYERLGAAYSRSGSRPRVIDIPARVFVADDTRATGRSYACNLRDGAAIPADYFGDTLRETNHRIFRRAHQFAQRMHGGDRAWSSFYEDFIPKRYTTEHDGWQLFAETFVPEALQDYAQNRVGILYLADPFYNVIGWHARMAQPPYPSAVNISEQIFINCDDETKAMFRNAIFTDSRIHEESWDLLKYLFIDIITT
jgi:hypothetical protein